MSEPSKRGLPTGGQKLSDRIAALQRKASDGTTPPNSSSSGSAGTTSSSMGGRSASGSSLAVPGSRSISGGASNARSVQDRIARFQAGAEVSGEKPLIPRSSFGAPTPAPGAGQGALKPYQGGGSGAWGEGVLRPQLTGGAWLGNNRGGPSADGLKPQYTGISGPGPRPQMTGGAWGRSRDFSDQPRMPGVGKDAFLELDEDARRIKARSPSPLSGGGSAAGSPARDRPPSSRRLSAFSAAQLDAASAGLARTSSLRRSASENTESEPPKSPLKPPSFAAGSVGDGLKALPDTPTTEPGSLSAAGSKAASADVFGTPAKTNGGMPRLPDPPTTLPTPPTTGSTSANSDIEIEVANASPTKMAALRRHLDDAELLGASRRIGSVAARSEASDDGGVSAIGRLALHESTSDEGDSRSNSPTDAFVKSAPPASQQALLGSDLPARAQVERTGSGRVDPADPRAHEVQGPELLVPSDDVAKRESSSSTGSDAGAKIAGYDAGAVAAYRESNVKPAESLSRHPRGARSSTSTDADALTTSGDTTSTTNPSERGSVGKTSASTPTRSVTLGNLPSSHSGGGLSGANGKADDTAQRARDAINLGRSKSQKLRRPPPGVMLTAADLDASDDEYE